MAALGRRCNGEIATGFADPSCRCFVRWAMCPRNCAEGLTITASHEDRSIGQEFRAGWQLALTATMGAGLTSVQAYSIGVFFGPIKQEFGWSAEIVLMGQAIIGVMAGIFSPFCGRVMDRIGARPLALTGTVMLAAGTAAVGLIPDSIPAFLACYLIIALGAVLCSVMIWQRIVVERFVKARGLALSIVLCGSNIAGSIVPILATLVIEQANWHVSYMVLGGYMVVTTLPLAWFFFHDTPSYQSAVSAAESAERADLAGMSRVEACGTREFWLMCLSFTLAGIGIAGYLVHLVPMLTAQGLPLLLAASAVSGLSIAAIAGRLIAGAFMDRVFAPRIASLALALPVLGSLALLLCPPGYWIALFAAVLVGLSSGAEFNMISYLTSHYFGLRSFGEIGGILYGVFMLGCIGGQQLPNFLASDGDYSVVILLFGGCFLLASSLMMFCRSYEVTRKHFVVTTTATLPASAAG